MLQVSVLTDQVEVQGEKIRDLETCLEHHQEKQNATEELLQQVTLQGFKCLSISVILRTMVKVRLGSHDL